MDERLLVIGIATMAGTFVSLTLCRPKQSCPNCKAPLPRISWKNVRSIWWGGWVCPKCGREIDRNGRELVSRSEG
jgi:hypothetical protein